MIRSVLSRRPSERRISVTPRNVKQDPRLRIISLGGVDEVGKNMTVFEYEDDIVVVDCGSIFPKEDMLGVDLVIPDVSYLVAKKKNVRGYLFTHGHEEIGRASCREIV